MNGKSVTKTHKNYVTIKKDAKESQITNKIMDLLEENEVNILAWTIIKALLDYKIEDASINYVIKNYIIKITSKEFTTLFLSAPF